ncbi:MAG: DUF3450 family protein [Opitutaceae bacterium]|jgi:hypothetical protein
MSMPPLRLVRNLTPLLLAFRLCAAPDADPLEPGTKAASDWIKTRLETARLESEWLTEKPLLESTVNGLKDRAGLLEEKLDHLKAKTAKDREEIETMQTKNQAASEDLSAAETRLQALTAKLNELRPMLPPRLSEALDLPYRSLANTGLGTGDRMQVAMTILNRFALFNHTVTCGEEVLTISGEQGTRSLEVIYWGLSHAYALDRAGGKVWYGSPGPKAWQWDPLPDAVGAVSSLIAVYNDKADPDFVAVPATLSQTQAEGANK